MSRIHTTKRRDFLKGACGLVAAGGASSFVPQLSMLGTALAQGTFNNYRALVCLYLDGGNDSWNLLIPSTPARHVEYEAARGGLYVGNAASLGIPITPPAGGGTSLPIAIPLLGAGNRVQQANGSVSVTGGNTYALNPFVAATPGGATSAGIHRVYNRADAATQRMAFLANVGPLVEPLRKTGFNTFRRPPQLYSHNDQTNLWQIGGGSNSSDPNGWGGRMTGLLLGAAPGLGLSPCISIAGQTRFLVGNYTDGASVIPYRLSTSGTNPATSLNNYSATDTASAGAARRDTMRALMEATYPQAFSQEYGLIVDRSLDLADTINSAIAGLANPPPGSPRANFNTILNGTAVTGIGPGIPPTNIGNQLRQVARMIAVSRFGQGTIQATRQVYFVRTGGYDTHDGQITSLTAANGHHGLLQQISQALAGFDAAMRALAADPSYTGLHNEVLTMSMSEFARTINSNGNGTDHAWGAVQLMMGGAVQGNGSQGQIIGPYPRQILGSTQNDAALPPLEERGECFNRGEFLPRIAVDQVAATVARWMGVSDANLPLLFPNIDDFANAAAGSPIAFRSRVIPGLLAGV